MSLDLGTLHGMIELDDTPYDRVLDSLPAKLRASGVGMRSAADLAATGIGTELADGIESKVEAALDSLPADVRAAGAEMEAEAKRAGENVGEELSEAIEEGTDTDPVRGKLGKGFDEVKGVARKSGDEIGGQLSSGMIAAIGAAAIGAAIGAGISNGLDLDAAQRLIEAQLNLTAEESGRIGAAAGKLYADAYGESVEDVGRATQDVVGSIGGMRDANEDALAEMTAHALNFATAFEVDTARSTQVVGQLLKTGLVKDGEEAFDLLTAAMQAVPANVREDILDALDEYGPFLQTLGFTGSEAMNMLVASSEKGMYGIDKTGDALKEFSIRATDMSKASKAGYDAIGLSQRDMTAELLKGGDDGAAAFEKIVGGLTAMKNPTDQASAALALFGTPLEDLGVNEIPKFLEGLSMTGDILGEVDGRASKMGDTLNSSVKTSWTETERTWQGIIGTVGGALIPVLDQVGQILNDNPVLLQAVAIALGILAVAFVAVTVATWAMNTALLANPITWIILGIVALIAAIVLLVANWDEVVAFISEVWANFVGWITEVIEGLAAWWGDVWEGITDRISETWDNIVAFITGALNAIVDMFLNWTLVGLLIQYWDEIWAGLSAAWEAILDFFAGIPDAVVGFFVGIGTWLFNAGSDLIMGIRRGVTNQWSGFLAFLKGIPGAVVGFFSGIGTWLFNAGKDLIDGLLKGVRSVAGKIGEFFLGILPSWIVGPFKSALGIASPSKVFAGFGANIGEGVMVGLDAKQSALDARVRRLVTVPSTDTLPTPQAGAEGLPEGARDRDGTGSLVIMGNVGWMPDELAREQRELQRRANALSGIPRLVGVAP